MSLCWSPTPYHRVLGQSQKGPKPQRSRTLPCRPEGWPADSRGCSARESKIRNASGTGTAYQPQRAAALFFWYYMGLHLGYASGLWIRINRWYGDKMCWDRSIAETTYGNVINQQNLYGGIRSEGGIWIAFDAMFWRYRSAGGMRFIWIATWRASKCLP